MKDKLIVRAIAIAEEPDYLREQALYQATTRHSKNLQEPVVIYNVKKEIVNDYIEKCCKQRNIPVNKRRKPSFASFGTSIN